MVDQDDVGARSSVRFEPVGKRQAVETGNAPPQSFIQRPDALKVSSAHTLRQDRLQQGLESPFRRKGFGQDAKAHAVSVTADERLGKTPGVFNRACGIASYELLEREGVERRQGQASWAI